MPDWHPCKPAECKIKFLIVFGGKSPFPLFDRAIISFQKFAQLVDLCRGRMSCGLFSGQTFE